MSCSAPAARLFGGSLPWFVFWGYNTFIVLAGTGYLLGITQGREYAEPEWYADLWLTVVWVAYLVVFLGTLWKRKEPHIYVANWFYLAFIVTIAMLHIVNNLAMPVSLLQTKSYSLFSGVQDALTQWWYGHNAVGFFLTAGFLGIMYYFIPKRAERPVYSYRLSIVHFWSLIFLYIWAGPHHLHYTALPDWAQTLGMTFSIMLWMPSWGGMINGLMTLSGAWDKLRTDPVLRMLVVSVAFYGMATFEGPLMSIKDRSTRCPTTPTGPSAMCIPARWAGSAISRSARSTAWCRGCGTKKLYSNALVEWHFWIATLGIVLYITSMWVAGIMQGLMWRAYNDFGFLEYSFVETVEAMHPYYIIRALRRPALSDRRADHGLQRLAHDPRGRRFPKARPRRWRCRAGGRVMNHGMARTQLHPAADRHHPDRRRHRRHGRDRAAVLGREHDREGRRHAALHAARAGRPQHLCPRRLLSLPQPDDPPAARRGRALRPLQPGRREHVRPSVPVGLQAHRARSRARRRQIFRRLAPRPPARSALGGAGLGDAALRLPGEDAARLPRHRRRAGSQQRRSACPTPTT